MSEVQSILEAQVGELMNLVEDYREESCNSIREQARTRTNEIVTQARHDARNHMRTAVKQERARAQEKIASTRAHLQTQRRLRLQQSDKLLVEQGWEMLMEMLIRRWQDADQRYVWIKTLIQAGLALLPAGGWRIEHPPGWKPDELPSLGDAIAGLPQDQSPTFVEDSDIAAGFRIKVGSSCVDGTMEGLLANRTAIESQLLAEFSRSSPQS